MEILLVDAIHSRDKVTSSPIALSTCATEISLIFFDPFDGVTIRLIPASG